MSCILTAFVARVQDRFQEFSAHTRNIPWACRRSATYSCRSLLVPPVERFRVSSDSSVLFLLSCSLFFVFFQGDGLAKIAWAFLRPIGAGGVYNVGVRSGKGSSSYISSENETRRERDREKKVATSSGIKSSS